jgi:hypothetical protein
MPNSSDHLRRAVFAELEKRRKQAEGISPVEQAKIFGAFIDVALTNLSMSRSVLARELQIEDELADAILDGLLPLSEIDDEFLIDIGRVIQYEPNLLRIMLGRETIPAGREGKVR